MGKFEDFEISGGSLKIWGESLKICDARFLFLVDTFVNLHNRAYSYLPICIIYGHVEERHASPGVESVHVLGLPIVDKSRYKYQSVKEITCVFDVDGDEIFSTPFVSKTSDIQSSCDSTCDTEKKTCRCTKMKWLESICARASSPRFVDNNQSGYVAYVEAPGLLTRLDAS